MKVGLQLYTIRDLMEMDMDAALCAVSKAGYEYVEFAGFFGKSADEINALLKKYNLKAISVHHDYHEMLSNKDGILDFFKQIGIKYAAVPYMGIEYHKGSDKFGEVTEDFVKLAEILKKYDIQLLYHNHEFEFNTYEGKYLNDWLIEAVGIENISPEIDTCWVKYAGASPVEYINKYSSHLPVIHLKDFSGNSGLDKTREENNFKLEPVGYGCQNFESVLDAAKKAGTEYLIVEQDIHYDADPIDNITKSREFLKKLGC